jgi:phosphoribosylanthranilate isomerase
VKICGITSAADAVAAVEAGADMLGFNFYTRSARFIEPASAAAIIGQVRSKRANVHCIGVFVNEESMRIREIAHDAGLDAVQLHGDETAEDIEALAGLRVIKAWRVGDQFDAAVISTFRCHGILLDSWHPGVYGGTGEQFDWSIAADVRRRADYLILAGGLHAGNVAAAIAKVQPCAVDVCSGIEDASGRKNGDKLREFMHAVAGAKRMTEVAS